jgi:hypothetical protein
MGGPRRKGHVGMMAMQAGATSSVAVSPRVEFVGLPGRNMIGSAAARRPGRESRTRRARTAAVLASQRSTAVNREPSPLSVLTRPRSTAVNREPRRAPALFSIHSRPDRCTAAARHPPPARESPPVCVGSCQAHSIEPDPRGRPARTRCRYSMNGNVPTHPPCRRMNRHVPYCRCHRCGDTDNLRPNQPSWVEAGSELCQECVKKCQELMKSGLPHGFCA